jgi:hypothetical protein
MTKQQVLRDFNENIKPSIPRMYDGTLDRIWLNEEWINYTDSLCRDGLITEKQYNNWSSPY